MWETYRQVDEHRRNIGSALHKLFSEGKVGGGDLDTVGIWSQNRPGEVSWLDCGFGLLTAVNKEWQQIDLALHAYGKVGVSLYDTFGAEAVGMCRFHDVLELFINVHPEYIIQHAHLSIIFVTSNHLATLLASAPKVPMMKIVVSIDDLPAQTKHVLQVWAKERKVQIMELSECTLL
jgi:long-chain acyl-CoA synthetase